MRTKNEIMKEAQELKDQHELVAIEAEALGKKARDPHISEEEGLDIVERMRELSAKSVKLVAKMKGISLEAYKLKKALGEYDLIG